MSYKDREDLVYVAGQRYTKKQRKLAKGILDVVGVLIKGGYKLDNMLNEVVMGRYL